MSYVYKKWHDGRRSDALFTWFTWQHRYNHILLTHLIHLLIGTNSNPFKLQKLVVVWATISSFILLTCPTLANNISNYSKLPNVAVLWPTISLGLGHCVGWGYETMACALCLSEFLWFCYYICSVMRKHDVIKWEHFPRYWPFGRGIHRSLASSPHKGQWRGVLMFSVICAWINALVSNREAGDLSRHRAHYDVIIIFRQKHTWRQLRSTIHCCLRLAQRLLSALI